MIDILIIAIGVASLAWCALFIAWWVTHGTK